MRPIGIMVCIMLSTFAMWMGFQIGCLWATWTHERRCSREAMHRA